MILDNIKNNKFFDKLLIVRGESNLQYMIDQLRECLESESVILDKDETLQLLDIFIRMITHETRYTENKELYPVFVMIGHIKINTESVDYKNTIEYIKNINSDTKIFSDNILNNIINNIEIICKEFFIFINELLDTLTLMFESIDTNKNVKSYIGILRSKNNKRFSVNYMIPPMGLNQMVYVIQSNIISGYGINQESLMIVEKSFNEDENFRKYIERVTKNQTL